MIGSLDLERALTSRDEINRHLSGVLDETTGRWGIKVTRVEIKAIEPPPSIRDSMEKQMRAERDRRAAILHAEGLKQSQILTAEGEKQAAVLRAEGDRQSRILQAEGQAKAIQTVFDAIHAANPDPKVLAYQYLQSLPQIAAGAANKLWIMPAELTKALEGIGGALGGISSDVRLGPCRSRRVTRRRGGVRRRHRGAPLGRGRRRGRQRRGRRGLRAGLRQPAEHRRRDPAEDLAALDDQPTRELGALASRPQPPIVPATSAPGLMTSSGTSWSARPCSITRSSPVRTPAAPCDGSPARSRTPTRRHSQNSSVTRIAHADDEIDVPADRLRLGGGVGARRDDDADVVPHDPEELGERLRADRPAVAAARGQRDRAGPVPVAAEVDDVRTVLVQVLQQVRGAHRPAGDEFEGVPVLRQPQLLGDLPGLLVEGEARGVHRVGRQHQHADADLRSRR